MAIQLEYRLLTVEDYHKMIRAGILSQNDQVELLNGQIIKMSPIGSQHAACVEKIDELLKVLLKGKASVRAQNPVILGDLSEPEPDIAIVKRKENYYADGHPQSDEIFLIMEVADSSLEKDRQAKLPIYARAMIPEYWIIDLENQSVEVYTNPQDNLYKTKRLFLASDTIQLEIFGHSLPVKSLLI